MSRFDLEQQLLDCWGMCDDLQVLIDKYDTLSEDEQLNILVGLRGLYELKFKQTFNTFETLVGCKDL